MSDISNCVVCANSNDILNSFTVLRKCSSDYDTKILEASLIKKYTVRLITKL